MSESTENGAPTYLVGPRDSPDIPPGDFSLRGLLLVAAVEGSAVVSLELLAGRILTPWYGTTLFVWSAVIGVTMLALLIGYFLGGRLSRRHSHPYRILGWSLLGASLLLAGMPVFSEECVREFLHFGLVGGSILSLGVILFPGLVLLGMIPPLLIGSQWGGESSSVGDRSGVIFAISTIGGIITSFLLGFLLVPKFGLFSPAMGIGLTTGLVGLWLLKAEKAHGLVGLWILSCTALMVIGSRQSLQNDRTLYHSEGLMGQVKVIEMAPDPQGRNLRALVVNNTMQTVFNPDDPDYTFWPYTRLVASITNGYPKGAKTLLLGVGGGTIARLLERQGCDQTLVEIDERLVQVSRDWFGLSDALIVEVDDARHQVKTSKGTFDVIICDAFRGESAPEHLLTLEGFQDMRAVLGRGGTILVNFYGYTDGPAGDLAWSVLHTAEAAGLRTQLLATQGSPDERNLLIRAWDPQNGPSEVSEWVDDKGELLGFEIQEIPSPNAVILTDDQPHGLLFSRAALQWRNLYNRYFFELTLP